MNKKNLLLTFFACLFLSTAFSQYINIERPANDWFHKDLTDDGIPGLSTNKAYAELLKGRESAPVVVAVIDSGTDAEHEDLAACIWVNDDEIAGNGIDDDGNGYIDDINGWTYLGNATEDIRYDNLEFTRVYRSLMKKYDGVAEASVSKEDKEEYERYKKMKKQYKKRIEDAESEATEFLFIAEFFNQAKVIASEVTSKGYDTIEMSDLEAWAPSNEMDAAMKELVMIDLQEDISAEIDEGVRHYSSMMDYSYNLEYDSRAIIGDDPNKLDEKGYGNNRVEGPAAEHGTHVAGIIGANRSNELGIQGVADNVRLMILRAVPDGDEHDKDVANAIRYAVDNGAQIINMSFGKSYSPDKNYVDEAVAYAESNGVLLIHASGNSNRNNDKSNNFPNATYQSLKGECSTWIEVGASGFKTDTTLVADFSNYGKKSVDVFAPGVFIYSTVPDDQYKMNQGTSMAAPMVSGVAAVLMSYFPELTARQVKDIIESSGASFKNIKVSTPGTHKKVKMKKISTTGKVVNLYNAVELALKKTGA